jgi:arginine/ornithine transport system permease protein
MDWQIILESLPQYLGGIRVTLTLLAISLFAGFFISIPMAIARVSNNPWLAKPVWFYTYVLRGTPLLVQLFMIYHGAV